MNEMMLIEINFGKNRSDQIIVHFNDTPEDLAVEFVRKHHLKEGAVAKVAKYIEETIEEFKSRNSQMRPQTPPLDTTEEKPIDVEVCRGAMESASFSSMQPPKEITGETIQLANACDGDEVLLGNDEVLLGNEEGQLESNSEGGDEPKSEEDEDIESEKATDDNDQESRYNRIRDNCSVASSNKGSEHIPLMEKMRRVDFFSASSSKRRKKKVVSANERLYKAASLIKERKEKLIQQSEIEVEKNLRANKFTMPEGSKKLLTRHRVGGTDSLSIGDRLHGEGLKEKDKKLKLAEAAKNEKEKAENVQIADRDRHVNTWSCYKCGTYYTFSSIQLKAFDFKKICNNCGIDQSSQKPFKPKNVASNSVSNDKKGSFVMIKSDKKVDSKTSGSIHDHLHAQKQVQEKKRIQLICKYLDEEQKAYPFKPTIPSSSEAIVEKLMSSDAKLIPGPEKTEYLSEAEAWYGSLANGRAGDRLSTSPHKKSSSFESCQDEAVPFGEYFRMPASDRLFVHGHKNRVERRSQSSGGDPITYSVSENEELMQQQRANSALSKKEFVNRLVYEYNDRKAKLDKLTLKYKPTFKPQVHGFSSHLEREVHSHDEFIVDLLRRGNEMKEKRHDRHLKAMKVEAPIESIIPKALPESERILQESNLKVIEELFTVLVNKEGTHSVVKSPDRQARFAGIKVNLDSLVLDGMVIEVQELLMAAKENHRASLKENGQTPNDMRVSFNDFSRLIFATLQKKKGIGKAYICAPKKKPDVTMKMMLEDEKELTFTPQLCIPASVLEGRMISGNGGLTDYLYSKVAELKKNADNIRERVHNDELKSCTFKPFLYKPPRHLHPSYRGLVGELHVKDTGSVSSIPLSPKVLIGGSGQNEVHEEHRSPEVSTRKLQPNDTPDSIQRRLDSIINSDYTRESSLDIAVDEILSSNIKSNRGHSLESSATIETSSSFAGIRELGSYEANYERRNSSNIEDLPPSRRRESGLDNSIIVERRLSQESFNILAHNIASELELEDIDDIDSEIYEHRNSDLENTAKDIDHSELPHSRSSSGGSEIDSRSIPFDSYQKSITNQSRYSQQYATHSGDEASSSNISI